jgi:hypothetical protein
MTHSTTPTTGTTEFDTTEPQYGSIGVDGSTTGQDAPLADAGRRTADTAGQLAERAANTGIQQVDRGREQTAEGLTKLADSMRRVSGELSDQQPMVQNVTQAIAEQTERAASYLRDTDARQIMRNVEDIARRQPFVFLGGAFLLGLVGARVLKMAAGGESGQSGQSQGLQGTSDLSGMQTGYGYEYTDRSIAPAGSTEI